MSDPVEEALTKLASMTSLEKDAFLHKGLKENYLLRVSLQEEQQVVDNLRSQLAIAKEALTNIISNHDARTVFSLRPIEIAKEALEKLGK